MHNGDSKGGSKDTAIMDDASSVISDDSDSWDEYEYDQGKVDSIPLTEFAGNSQRELNDDHDSDGELFGLSKRRGSNATDETFMLYTPDEEQTVIKKFDRRLVLFVALLYLLSFLDRSSTYTPSPPKPPSHKSQTSATPKSPVSHTTSTSPLLNTNGSSAPST